MYKTKWIASLLLALSLLALAAGPALAAQDPTPLTGLVKDVVLVIDPVTDVVTVEVTVAVSDTLTETVVISLDDAVALGLVTLDSITQEPAVNLDAYETEVTIAPEMILPTEEESDGDGEHPIARLLADFFGVEYDLIFGIHEDGTGFGVIAQSCWASYRLAGDASLCEQIADAKQSGDYSALTLPDGSTPTNWGQFKRALREERSVTDTLGAINSGRAGESLGDADQPAGKNNRPENGNNGNHGNPDNKGKGNRPNK